MKWVIKFSYFSFKIDILEVDFLTSRSIEFYKEIAEGKKDF
jgi:hypothetical protein